MNRYGRSRRDLRPGEFLFNEGDAADCAFLVEAGELEVFREEGNERRILGRLGPGELLGEMALLDGRARSANVIACEPTAVRIITRAHLRDRLSNSDPLLRLLLNIVLQRYRAAIRDPAHPELVPDIRALSADQEAAMNRLRMAQALEEALEREEFELHYQPIVGTEDLRTAGFEALIRWRRPGVGLVPPGQFIPAAEDSELIEDIGRWVLNAACAALARLSAKTQDDGKPLYVSVNIAGRHLSSPRFFDDVFGALQTSGLPAAQLTLDITETQFIERWEAASAVLARLRGLGVQVAIDDFGVGYSSLSALHRQPADALKVDRAFVVALETGTRGRNIIKGIAALAHALELTVIVEGVEEEAQARFLRDYGFEYIQGFYYAKPVPEDEALAFVNRSWPAPRKLLAR